MVEAKWPGYALRAFGLQQAKVVRRWLVPEALALEAGLFLWAGLWLKVPWPVAGSGALVVSAALLLETAFVARPVKMKRRWPVFASLLAALVVDLAVASFLTLVLFIILAQGSLAGNGILPFLVVPLVLALAVHMEVGLPLFLALTLVLLLGTGVLMDAGPIEGLAVPLVLSIGVAVILFQAISPEPRGIMRRMPRRDRY